MDYTDIYGLYSCVFNFYSLNREYVSSPEGVICRKVLSHCTTM